MEDLIARIAAAAGVEPEIAKKSVEMILAFLRKEGPQAEVDALFAAVPGAAEAADAASGESGGGALNGLIGAMGGGIVGLAGRLTSLGLCPREGRRRGCRPSCCVDPRSCPISLESRNGAAFLRGNLARNLRKILAVAFKDLVGTGDGT
jgi:hypothetical protein